MKHLIIIGARGFGREVYNSACESLGYKTDFDIKGYLDDKVSALDGYDNYPPILGAVETYVLQPDDVFICALGDVKWKKYYSQIILNKGGEFISLVHPTAYVGLNSSIGLGCIIEKNVVVSCDAKIGDFVTLMPSCVLGHDIVVDSWSHVGSFSFMGGFSKIGLGVTLQPSSHILPHKVVGNYSTVGSNSVVMRNVKEGTTVFGNPAKKLEVV